MLSVKGHQRIVDGLFVFYRFLKMPAFGVFLRTAFFTFQSLILLRSQDLAGLLVKTYKESTRNSVDE